MRGSFRDYCLTKLGYPSKKVSGACGRTRTYEGPSGPPDLQSGAFATQPHMQIKIRYVKKRMKAARTLSANTLRDTLLLRMAISRTLAKRRDRHPVEGSCLHLSQKGTSIVKKQKERAFSLSGKLPAPNNSREFFVGIGSGSPLPLTKTY